MNILPFDLESFKAGQKALTRDGRVAMFVGICEACEEFSRLLVLLEGEDQVMFYSLKGTFEQSIGTYTESRYDLVSMKSRHQHLIDSYDPEDTWQEGVARHGNLETNTFIVWFCIDKPSWNEQRDYRLHPHNDLIKAWKKGAKIEISRDGLTWEDTDEPAWNVALHYRIKQTTNKTVYEWMVKGELGYWHLNGLLLTEDEAAKEFADYEYKKTGRHWEWEV